MNGKITITVTDGKISVQGSFNDASEAGELSVVHALLRAMGYQGDKMVNAVNRIILVDHIIEHKEEGIIIES